MRSILKICLVLTSWLVVTSCSDDNKMSPDVHNPDKATAVSIDRFSDASGHLFVRSANADLPAANAAINFDMAPFIATGYGPDGQVVQYYNFDVQSTDPAPIYVLFKEGESSPVSGQLNIIDDIPGDADYNDFWRVNKVTVPSDYVANQVASLDEIHAAGYAIEQTDMLVNCPVVPQGSTASKRLGSESSELHKGWYRGMAVFYFQFNEKSLSTTGNMVPVAPVFVTFNTNGDPSSGFMTEAGTAQTHNVVSALPSDTDYSPLWVVSVYSNSDFPMVMDLMTAESADILNGAADIVNCPVVSIE